MKILSERIIPYFLEIYIDIPGSNIITKVAENSTWPQFRVFAVSDKLTEAIDGEVSVTLIFMYERVVKFRIIVQDEEKSLAGLFFGRRFWPENTPRSDFDEVLRDKTDFNNTLYEWRCVARKRRER